MKTSGADVRSFCPPGVWCSTIWNPFLCQLNSIQQILCSTDILTTVDNSVFWWCMAFADCITGHIWAKERSG